MASPGDNGSAVDLVSNQKVKLITVHGTGAGDTTATGDHWWQIGSSFITSLSRRLDLDPEQIELCPFQWEEGPNSEEQRRLAGGLLLAQLIAYEEAGCDYYVIGHSHGGSVIYSALLQAERENLELKRLKSWCTVGTPFLDYRPNAFMFQRLRGMGLTILSSGFAAALIAGAYWLKASSTNHSFEDIEFLDNVAIVMALYAVLCVLVLFVRERRHKGWFSPAQKRKVDQRYSPSWLGLWHQEDEAISALSNVQSVSGSIVEPSFLQPLIGAAQIILVLGFGLWLAGDTVLGGQLLERFFVMVVADDGTSLAADDKDGIFLFIYLTVMMAFFFFFVRLVTWFLKKALWLLGWPLSSLINKVIWTSVRERAWGDDLDQEAVFAVAAQPPDFHKSFGPLPECIAGPLRSHSDGHAISTLNKVRLILGMATDAPASADVKTELAESLKWKELIHTSYFDVPEFVDLISIGLSRAGLADLRDGFESRPALRDEMEAWLESGAVVSTTNVA